MLNRENQRAISVLVLFFIAGTLVIFSNFKANKKFTDEENIRNEYISRLTNHIEQATLKAKAISIYDITWDIKLYGNNDKIPMPLASLAKIMSAWVILTDSPSQVILSEESIKQLGDNGLYVKEEWDREDLLKFSLITSSNDGITALLSNVDSSIAKMNEKAQRLGLNSMYFENTTGLDTPAGLPGAIGSAEDMNQLNIWSFKYLPNIFEATKTTNTEFVSISGIKHTALNTNIIIDQIPNLLFSKTGNTVKAGGNLSIIFKDIRGHTIAVTLLGSSALDRFEDMKTIVNIINSVIIN